MPAPSTIGLVLAGGRSRRFHNEDKTFLKLGGKPLWQHALARLAPQVDAVTISSNTAPERFIPGATDGTPITVLPDLIPGFQGPLAGIHAGLSAWPGSYVATIAVDLPFIPADLVARLRAGLRRSGCAYATDGTQHALALLWAPGNAENIAAFLAGGGRSVHDWLIRHGDPVPFIAPGDSDLFININTLQDLVIAEQRIRDLTRS
ncbi:MAG: molybdenum cofactor guanylyltransferase MobA [Acidiferrobacterales bacterium]